MGFIMRHGPRLDATCFNTTTGEWVTNGGDCARMRFSGYNDIDTPLTKTHHQYIVNKMKPVITPDKKKRVTIIYTSPFLRCVQTAIVAAKYLGGGDDITIVLSWVLGESREAVRNIVATNRLITLNKEATTRLIRDHMHKFKFYYDDVRVTHRTVSSRFKHKPVFRSREALKMARRLMKFDNVLVVTHAGLVSTLAAQPVEYADTFELKVKGVHHHTK